MKTTLFTTFILAILFVSCDKVDELKEVTLNETFTEEITINLSEDNANISETLAINFSDNADLAPYLNKIEDVQITEMSYILKDYRGVEEALGSLTAVAASQTFGPFNHVFFTDAQSAKRFNFVGGSKIAAIANALQNSKRINIAYTGTQEPSQNGSFTIQVTVKVRIIAEAI